MRQANVRRIVEDDKINYIKLNVREVRLIKYSIFRVRGEHIFIYWGEQMKNLKNVLEKNHDLIKEIIITLSICILLFANYSVLLSSNYMGDDIYNSCVKGNCNELNIGIWQYMFKQAKGWLGNGRVYPLAVFVYLVFYIFDNRYMYKIFLIIITLIDILLEGCIIKRITKSVFWKYFGMVILGLLFMVFVYGGVNCLSMFGGLVQMVLFWGMQAIIWELKYYENEDNNRLWLSAFLGVCAMLTYEIGYIFPCVLFMISVFKSRDLKELIKIQIPNFLLCGGVGVFTLLWMALRKEERYPGVEIGLNVQKMLETFRIQFTGALPMINWNDAKRPWYLSEKWVGESYENMHVTTGIIVILFIIFILFCLLKVEYVKIEREQRKILMVIGMIIWMLPSFLIAISVKYQEVLVNTNLPYLPYMMEVAGVVFFLIGLFGGRFGKVIFGCFLVGIVVVVIPVGRYGAALESESGKMVYEKPREILIEATENGIFSDIEEDALVILDNRYVVLSCQVFSMIQPNLKTDYLLYLEQSLSDKARTENIDKIDCSGDNLYLVKPYISDGVEMVVSGKIETVIMESGGEKIKEIYCSKIDLYSKWLYFGAPTEVSVTRYDFENNAWVGEGMDLMENIVEEEPDGIILKHGYNLSFQNELYDYNKFIF